MENNELNVLNINNSEELKNEKKKDLDVLNLNEQEKSVSCGNLEGTGVKSLRIISVIIIVLGIILGIIGIAQLAHASSYHPEREYIGTLCILGALSCFFTSPVYKVLAIIGEAAKIYKDKHTN